MTEKLPLTIERLREPISENTRKIRRELLIVCAIGIVIAYAGLVPTKIDALGIELDASNQASVHYVMIGVILYLTIAFVIYVSSEIIAWSSLFRSIDLKEQLEHAEDALKRAEEALKDAKSARLDMYHSESGTDTAQKELLLHKLGISDFRELKQSISSLRKQQTWLFRVLTQRDSLSLLKPMSALRISFEVLVPIGLAIFAIISLLNMP